MTLAWRSSDAKWIRRCTRPLDCNRSIPSPLTCALSQLLLPAPDVLRIRPDEQRAASAATSIRGRIHASAVLRFPPVRRDCNRAVAAVQAHAYLHAHRLDLRLVKRARAGDCAVAPAGTGAGPFDC